MRRLSIAFATILASGCTENADRAKAVAIATRTVERSGMDMKGYQIRNSDVRSTEDGKWWRVVFRCGDKNSPPGCHAQVLLNIETEEARLSASSVDPPEKAWPRASNGIPRDANMKCSDSSQCESLCLGPPDALPGEDVIGRCSISYDHRCGDVEVTNGKQAEQKAMCLR